jgi:signal transduction histidine kinase
MRSSLRLRFALASGALVVAISAGVAAAGYLSLERSLSREAARAAAGQAAALAAVVDPASRTERGDAGAGGNGNFVDLSDPSLVRQFTRPGLWVEVLGPDGRVIRSSPGSPGAVASPSVVARCGRSGGATESLTRPAAAVACRRVGGAGRPTGYLVAAKPLAEVNRTLGTTLRALEVAVTLGGLLSFALAWLLARRALRPLRLISGAARSIRAGDLSRRIDHTARDELGEVAAELDASFAELEAALRRQERFVADASHELKTPLAAARANVQLLRRWAMEEPQARAEALAALERSTARMGRVVADLLQLAHGDEGIRYASVPVRLDDVVLEVQREARALADGVEVVVEQLDPVAVTGDRDRLQQLLANLVDNAVRASAAGDTVRLSLSREGDRALVRVADEGAGIPPDELPHVFDRFFRGRASAPGDGSGLGLAIARAIARAHGGEIRVASAPDEGSAFTVELPLEVSPDRHRGFIEGSSAATTVVSSIPRR